MDIVSKLTEKLIRQEHNGNKADNTYLERNKHIARVYAQTENCIAVLSDMSANSSFICRGLFSQTLGMQPGETDTMSIWEKDILRLIHPEDLQAKFVAELSFFEFISNTPPDRRSNYHLENILRMKNKYGTYINVLHRLHYLSGESGKAQRFALCLYGPLTYNADSSIKIVNSVTGHTTDIEYKKVKGILSARETEILKFIDKGMSSKLIAEVLSISINTVSRHRHDILSKLKAGNSIEACALAKDMKII